MYARFEGRISLAIFLGLFALPVSAAAETTGPYRIRTEARVVPDSGLREVTSEAHFPYPPGDVWALLNRFSDLPNFIPRLKAFDSLGKLGGTEQMYALFVLPVPLPNLWNIVALSRSEKNRRFEWKMLRGNIEANTGSFSIEAESGGSVIRLSVQVDAGHLLPQWLVGWAARNYVPKVLKAVGDRLQKPRK